MERNNNRVTIVSGMRFGKSFLFNEELRNKYLPKEFVDEFNKQQKEQQENFKKKITGYFIIDEAKDL